MSRRHRLGALYRLIGRTYVAWMRPLLLIAVVIFVPVGFLDSLVTEVDVGSLSFSNGLAVAGVLGLAAVITITALLGEVFYSGAVAVSLTHPEHGHAPSLREVAGRLNYKRLIAVDLLYGLFVTVGLALFIAPGVVLFVWLGLAGPIVELEGVGVRAAFSRSWHLVRGDFWFVLCVLAPIEVVGDAVADGVADGVHSLLGHSFFAVWLAEAASNVVFAPFFAVAAVLLTLELIVAKEGSAPELNPRPTPLPA